MIDKLLKEQAEAQKELASQKQVPSPGQLAEQYPYTQIEFASKDGQIITGNLYKIGNTQPVILLCHQAGYNKYEYADIAPKLNQMGFNALAIDQRSGGPFGDQNNETANRAQAAGMDVGMLQAEQDLEAAVDYLYKKFGHKIILWGSSYSSSLALFVTSKSDQVSAVIAFSPGDYFGEQKPSLSVVLKGLDKPFFITSSKEEAETVSGLLADYAMDENHVQFIPEGKGYHGSRALWQGQKGGEEYWQAITEFLSKVSR
ncbi:MAG: alpha/beta hydrolase [Roseivirga sp.]|nr:alpha/beta hydrolase [Roseivirga sp.]